MAGPSVASGAVLDGFTVGECVHHGGMATLWSVTRPDLTLPLLMKIPRISEGDDPAAIVGFEMEQMILPLLSGPHVPRFVASGDVTAEPYLVMERIRGRSLLPLLEDLPRPYEEAAALGVKIANALHDLHRQNVIHLDVKPSNVMVRETGEVALIDYGLAHHDALPDLLDEEFRVPYGTAPYMAPEQVLGHRRDPRSDLFSLGVLLYFFTTGLRPFGDPKGKRRLHRRLWKDPIPPRRLRKDYPPALQEIVLRCLEVDPARRHATAAQLALDLVNPADVKLTTRSEKVDMDPWSAVVRRRFHPDAVYRPPRVPVAQQIAQSPIVAVALDVSDGSEALSAAIRDTVRRMVDVVPGARFACLNVLKQHLIALDRTLDDEGRNIHLRRLAALKSWAQKLGMPDARLTFHVLPATDPAAAILDYARTNGVDHIVLGARTDGTLRNLLGSVSGEIVAKAPCTVTVVRPRGAPGAG
jgi:serine/threonine protein kinase